MKRLADGRGLNPPASRGTALKGARKGLSIGIVDLNSIFYSVLNRIVPRGESASETPIARTPSAVTM